MIKVTLLTTNRTHVLVDEKTVQVATDRAGYTVVEGTNTGKVQVSFPAGTYSDWTKSVVMTNAQSKSIRIELTPQLSDTFEFNIPIEMTIAPYTKLLFQASQGETVQRWTVVDVPIARTAEGQMPPIPSNDAEQIRQIATDAKDIAQSVRDDADAGKFSGGSAIEEWQSGTTYKSGSLVVHNNALYRCAVAETTEEPKPISTAWTLLLFDTETQLRYLGVKPFAEIPPANEVLKNNLFTISDNFTTTEAFIGGTGKEIPANALVEIVYSNNDSGYKYLILNEQALNNDIALSEKLDFKIYPVPTGEIAQTDALEILNAYANYEGSIIQFLSNSEAPNRLFAQGWVCADKLNNQYLIVINIDGTITQWNKSSYEKHNVECRSLVNQDIDMDNLTIDKQGEAPYTASVRNARNKPPETSSDGKVTIFAVQIDKQIQEYTDIDTGKEWFRIVTGLADSHSFGVWTAKGGGSSVTAVKNTISADNKLTTKITTSTGEISSPPVELPSGAGQVAIPDGTDLNTYDWNSYPDGTRFAGKNLNGVPAEVTGTTESVIVLTKYPYENYRFAITLYYTGATADNTGTYINYYCVDKFKGWERIDGDKGGGTGGGIVPVEALPTASKEEYDKHLLYLNGVDLKFLTETEGGGSVASVGTTSVTANFSYRTYCRKGNIFYVYNSNYSSSNSAMIKVNLDDYTTTVVELPKNSMHFSYFVLYKDIIYSFRVNSITRYDTLTDTILSPLNVKSPSDLYEPIIAFVFNDTIYCEGRGIMTTFNPITNTYGGLSYLNWGPSAGNALVYGDYVYIGDEISSRQITRLNPVTKDLKSITINESSTSAYNSIINDEALIYFINRNKTIDTYDTNTETLTKAVYTLPFEQSEIMYIASCCYKGSIYYMFGQGNNVGNNTIYKIGKGKIYKYKTITAV